MKMSKFSYPQKEEYLGQAVPFLFFLFFAKVRKAHFPFYFQAPLLFVFLPFCFVFFVVVFFSTYMLVLNIC